MPNDVFNVELLNDEEAFEIQRSLATGGVPEILFVEGGMRSPSFVARTKPI